MIDTKKYWQYFEKFSPSLMAIIGKEAKIRMTINDKPAYDFSDIGNLYICPICLNNAIYKDRLFSNFLQEQNVEIEFTEDHFPPKNVCGRELILVCKSCNNDLGSEIDYSPPAYINNERFLNKHEDVRRPLALSFENLKGLYRTEAYWNKGVMTFLIPGYAEERIINHMESFIEDGNNKLHFRFKVPSRRLFSRALIKAAYLKCFSVFGYDYVFSESGKKLARIFKGEHVHEAEESYGVFFHPSNLPQKDGLYRSSLPNGDTFYVVYFTLKLEKPAYTQTVVVIVPGSNSSSWSAMKRLPNGRKTIRIHSELIPVEDFVEKGQYYAYTNRSAPMIK